MASLKRLVFVVFFASVIWGCKNGNSGGSDSEILSEPDHSKYYDVNDPFNGCYYDWEPGWADLLYICTGEKKGADYCLEKYRVLRDNDWDWRFKSAHAMVPIRKNPLFTYDKAWAVFEKPDNNDVNDRFVFKEYKPAAWIDRYENKDGSKRNVVGPDGTFKRSFTLDIKTGKARYTVEFKENGLLKSWKPVDDHILHCRAPDPSKPRLPTPPSKPIPSGGGWD